ncbi:hypothetical protein CCP3SC1_1050001 [Gammaproteobacteria bacterium]
MKQVLDHVVAGNFGSALTRLWVLAEGSENSIQRLSLWQQRWDNGIHQQRLNEYKKLFHHGKQDPFPFDAAEYPLALIEALDIFHATERPTSAVVTKSSAHDLDIEGTKYYLLRRPPFGNIKPPAERQSPNLEKYFRHFRVVPNHVKIGGAKIEVRIEFLEYVSPQYVPEAENLHFRITHFRDEAALQLDEDSENGRFFVTGLDRKKDRENSLAAELETVRNDAVSLWVVPELTVSPDLRHQLANWLAEHPAKNLLLCVPGSFHEQDGANRVNRSIVLNANGRSVTYQDKCSQFSFPSDQGELHEHIIARRAVTLLVTPIGLVGIAICKDHFDAGADGLLHAAWDRLAPDWLLVPSMGDGKTVKAHQRRARDNWNIRHTRTLVANQEPRTTSYSPDPAPGFIHRTDNPEPVTAGGSTFAPPTLPTTPLLGNRKPPLKAVK